MTMRCLIGVVLVAERVSLIEAASETDSKELPDKINDVITPTTKAKSMFVLRVFNIRSYVLKFIYVFISAVIFHLEDIDMHACNTKADVK
jgi:hypothetical protein